MNMFFRKNKFWLAVFVAPTLLLFGIIIVIPLCQSFYYSFFEWNGIKTVAFRGLENYKKMFTSREINISVINSIIYAFVLVLYQVGMGMLLAFILTQSKLKGSIFFRNIFFIPVLLSISVVAQLWKFIYNPECGLINQFLALLGCSWQQNWMNRKGSVLLAVIFVEAWKGMGYVMLIIYAGFKNVPEVYNDAAKIDGASAGQRFLHVTMPLSATTVRMTIVMCLTNGFRAFDTVWLMTKGGPGTYTYNMTIMMYNAMISKNDYGYGSAIAVFIVIICISLMYFINRVTGKYDKIYG